jgi:hypothetical protein
MPLGDQRRLRPFGNLLRAAGLGDASHPVAKPIVPEGNINTDVVTGPDEIQRVLGTHPEEHIDPYALQFPEENISDRMIVRPER